LLFIPPLGLPIFLSSFLFLYLNTKNDGRHSFLVSTIILAFQLYGAFFRDFIY